MLLAYHSNPAIREEYLRRVIDHRAADQLIKGRYWEDGKGCAVGCTIHSSNHASYEKELGIPSELAYLEDFIFEDLPNARAMMWPEQFLAAIPVGADLSMVCHHWLLWLMTDAAEREDTDEARSLVRQMTALMERSAAGDEPSAAEWDAMGDNWARATAMAMARARAWAGGKNFDEQVIREADKLLELLAAAPVRASLA